MLFRIDDRLLHGQVIEGWIKPLGIRRVVIISETLSKDPVQPELMRMVVPDGTEVHLLDVAQACERLKEQAASGGKTLVLAPSPSEALELVRAGVRLEIVNVGGLHAQNAAAQISPSLSLGASDWKTLKKILEAGVRLEAQPIPTEPPMDLSDWLAKSGTLF